MAELKTKLTQASVDDFLNAIPDAQIREDCWAIVEIMQEATQAPPRMWGASIVGFGSYHYKYASGREADQMLAQLGKHTCGKSCLYIKRLSDVHMPTLKQLVHASVQHMIKTNPSDMRQ